MSQVFLPPSFWTLSEPSVQKEGGEDSQWSSLLAINRLDVLAVSKHQCRFFFVEPHHFVEDLGSRDGTYLNEHRLEKPGQLNDGDRIRVCDAVFSFHRVETTGPV